MVDTRQPESETLGSNLDADPKVYLIDFGFSDKYVEIDGKNHISDEETVEVFKGNFKFSSPGQMAFKKTSRRDDFISLFYMLIFMLNDRKLWVGDDYSSNDHGEINDVYESIHVWKNTHCLSNIAYLFSKEFVLPI